MFWPMFAMVVLTYAVLGINFAWRYKSVRSGQVRLGYYKVFEGDAPLHIKAGTRHYANLFELPVLFYAACCTALAVNLQSPLMLFFAWAFVVARVVHSFIHMRGNKVLHRLVAFWCSVLALFGVWLVLALRFLPVW